VPVTVGRIRFPNVFDAETARAHVYFQQSVPDVDAGGSIAVGPTPLSHLVVTGTVEAVDDAANEVRLDVAVAEAPVTEEYPSEVGSLRLGGWPHSLVAIQRGRVGTSKPSV